MPSDYHAITKHNERQLGLDTASRKTQICMYSDSTHFVYEILQNADDYGAKEIHFHLTKSGLTIEHDGQPFEEENVKAITYFGKSTSAADLVKTGRFGVGFKSVFAFTATPIVISGEEHFKIHGLYRVSEQPYPEGLSRRRTRIVLPFNHEKEMPDYVDEWMPVKEAYKKISARLTGLNMNTLLFTKNIREIKWAIDGRSGHYLREDKIRGGARETVITDGESVNNYLVFARTPIWHNEAHRDVEIAFGLNDKGQLQTIDDYLYVLFSTTQETHLQFIINGPYRTNPSRETISEEDNFNRHLMKETCSLLEEVLPELRDRKKLSTNALSVMPNNTDKLRPFYTPLLETVINLFSKEDLIPTDDGEYCRSEDIFQGPAPIREVITRKELLFFTGNLNVQWAKGISPGSRPDMFLKSLEIEQWGWEQLEDAITSKFSQGSASLQSAINWFGNQSDQWLQKLYCLLAEGITRQGCSAWRLKRCTIICISVDGMKKTYTVGSRAYFPKGRGYKDLPQVVRSILKGKNQSQTKKIEEALVVLGVKEIGEAERIDLILETYYREEEARISPQQHLDHMKLFIKWLKKEKSPSKFEGEAIFRTVGSDEMSPPEDCYLDSPLKKTGLDVIYKSSHKGIPKHYKLWSKYRDLAGDGFCDFALACGVAGHLCIVEQYCRKHPQWNEIVKGLWSARETCTQIDRDYDIPSLQSLLRLKKREINLLIWRTLSRASPKVLEARYRPNQQYGIRTRKSSLVIALSVAEWIPDKRGRLKKPFAISKDQLHSSFKYDNRNGWLDEIGFGEEARKTDEKYKKKKEMAEGLGIPVEMAEYFDGLSEEERKKEFAEFKALVSRKKAARRKQERIKQENISFQEALGNAFSAQGSKPQDRSGTGGGSTKKPARRRQKTQEEINVAIENEGRSGPRFSFQLRKQWKGKNDVVRAALASWYEGKCQICGETFTQRSGEPYFEGLYLVPYTAEEWLDRVGNVLCLCPWHSAKFQYGAKEFGGDVVQSILNLKISAEGGNDDPALQMKLCGKDVHIKFKDNHLLDLQEMIKASQSAEKGAE